MARLGSFTELRQDFPLAELVLLAEALWEVVLGAYEDLEAQVGVVKQAECVQNKPPGLELVLAADCVLVHRLQLDSNMCIKCHRDHLGGGALLCRVPSVAVCSIPTCRAVVERATHQKVSLHYGAGDASTLAQVRIADCLAGLLRAHKRDLSGPEGLVLPW